jgi:hypothetical protein
MNVNSDLKKADKILGEKTSLIKHQDLIALFCFFAAVVFFCWKAPFGFGFDDESFYLSIPHRLTMGDSLLTDEWQLSQLSGFLLYLPVKLYIFIIGSTDGIILFFRYLFITLQCTVSAVIYCLLRKYGIFGILAALIFYLHIPFFTNMGLGYYATGLAFVLVAGLLMATTKKYSGVKFYFVGIFFACAVLCNPLLAFVYFLYSFFVIFYKATKNKGHRNFSFSEITFSLKTLFWITFGILTIATCFFIFLFSRTSLNEIINNFPMLFTDPEYTGSGVKNVFSLQKALTEIVKISPYPFAVFSVLTIVLALDKNRIPHRRNYLAVACAIYFTYIVLISLSIVFPNYGYWMLPLTLLGLICYILSENKNKNSFVFLWVFGILYSLCLNITSDQGFIIGSQGLIVSDVASVMFVKNIIDELKIQKGNKEIHFKPNRHPHDGFHDWNKLPMKVLILVLTATLFVQICQECYISSDFKFYTEYLILDSNAKIGVSINRDSAEILNVMIKNGPEKGIKTTAARAKIYNDILIDLSYIKEKGYNNVLVAGNLPWCYLYLDLPYSSLSAWFLAYNISAQTQRLSKYYELHPEKLPKYIYIPKVFDLIYAYMPDERTELILNEITSGYEFTIKESDVGYIVEILN